MTTIINLTPHPITIGSLTITPTSPPARAGEWVEPADPITVTMPTPRGEPAAGEDDARHSGHDSVQLTIPTSWVTYTRLEDLPNPQPDVCYVVSLVVAQAAAVTQRSTADLLTPGEQVRDAQGRDAQGRVIGCKSLARVGRGIPTFRWRDQQEAFVVECLRQGGSSDVGAEREVGHLGRYARNYASAPIDGGATIAARSSDLVTFYAGTRRGRGVWLTGVPFGTVEQMDAAYGLLARAGATCNDARPDEREAAAAALAAAT